MHGLARWACHIGKASFAFEDGKTISFLCVSSGRLRRMAANCFNSESRGQS